MAWRTPIVVALAALVVAASAVLAGVGSSAWRSPRHQKTIELPLVTIRSPAGEMPPALSVEPVHVALRSLSLHLASTHYRVLRSRAWSFEEALARFGRLHERDPLAWYRQPRAHHRSSRSSMGDTGTLEISSSPWCRVIVDGQVSGVTPISLELPVGKHRVQLESDDSRRSRTLTVKIKKGEPVKKNVVFVTK